MKNFFKTPKWLNDFVVHSQDCGPEPVGLIIIPALILIVLGDIVFFDWLIKTVYSFL